MKKSVKTLIIICAAVFLIIAGFLAVNFVPLPNNKYDEFKANSESVSSKPLVSSILSGEELADNPIDFVKLKAHNDEAIGWIKIPEMPKVEIDYPIMQSGMDTKEDFYLENNLDKKKSREGAIYIQKMNFSNFTDPNTVIYGHDMRNKSMFGQLEDEFTKKDFFDEHDKMYIYVPGHILTYKIYSAFRFDDRHILATYDFSKKEDFKEFIDLTLNPKSKVKNVREGVKVTTEDRLITLSTCTNNEKERYLVVAVLVDDTYTN